MASYKPELRAYELVVVFDSDLTEADVNTELGKIEETVGTHNGKLNQTEIWGRRQLAYLINKKSYGVYTVLQLEGDNKLVADLERQFQINELVLRFLFCQKDQFAPDLSDRLREQAMPLAGQAPRTAEGSSESASSKEAAPASKSASSEAAPAPKVEEKSSASAETSA